MHHIHTPHLRMYCCVTTTFVHNPVKVTCMGIKGLEREKIKNVIDLYHVALPHLMGGSLDNIVSMLV